MVTPTAISRYLSDLRFPATKDELAQRAEENDAPDYLVDALDAMPDEVYESLAEVWVVIGSPQ